MWLHQQSPAVLSVIRWHMAHDLKVLWPRDGTEWKIVIFCKYIYIYIYTLIYIYICIYNIYIYIYICISIITALYIYILTCMCIYIYTHTFLSMLYLHMWNLELVPLHPRTLPVFFFIYILIITHMCNHFFPHEHCHFGGILHFQTHPIKPHDPSRGGLSNQEHQPT